MQKTAIKIQIKKHIASINSNIKNTTSFAKHCVKTTHLLKSEQHEGLPL